MSGIKVHLIIRPGWVTSSVSYVKFFCRSSTSGDHVSVRVMAGADRESAQLAGNLVLPAYILEQLLDVTIHGASDLRFDGGKLEVYYGPDDDVQLA